MSHYQIEDEPKVDVDTTLAMYQQSKAVVADGAGQAERLLGEAGPLLETIYNAASAAQNSELMAAANAAFAKTQELAILAGQQDAALNGADVVINVIKQSRQAVLDELNTIIKGLDDGDASMHPKLEAFKEQIEEYATEWMYEDAMDYADEMMGNEIFETLSPLVQHHSSTVRLSTINTFNDLLHSGGEDMTPEQEELFRKLLATCLPDTVKAGLAPIEDADDYESDEDDES